MPSRHRLPHYPRTRSFVARFRWRQRSAPKGQVGDAHSTHLLTKAKPRGVMHSEEVGRYPTPRRSVIAGARIRSPHGTQTENPRLLKTGEGLDLSIKINLAL